jgi:hypothetical protein
MRIKFLDDPGDLDLSGCAGGSLSFESAPVRMHLPDDPSFCTGQSASVIDLWLVPL